MSMSLSLLPSVHDCMVAIVPSAALSFSSERRNGKGSSLASSSCHKYNQVCQISLFPWMIFLLTTTYMFEVYHVWSEAKFSLPCYHCLWYFNNICCYCISLILLLLLLQITKECTKVSAGLVNGQTLGQLKALSPSISVYMLVHRIHSNSRLRFSLFSSCLTVMSSAKVQPQTTIQFAYRHSIMRTNRKRRNSSLNCWYCFIVWSTCWDIEIMDFSLSRLVPQSTRKRLYSLICSGLDLSTMVLKSSGFRFLKRKEIC